MTLPTQPNVRKPACMDQEEFADWLHHQYRISSSADLAASPCYDCIPDSDYYREMRASDRCDGTPGEPLEPEPRPGLRYGTQEAYQAERQRKKRAAAKRAWELLRTGMSQAAAAREMGISPAAVSKYARLEDVR